jgi:hypothetical protein
MAELVTRWTVGEVLVPAAVVCAIRLKFSESSMKFEQVMKQLKYDSVLKCFTFTHAGMLHGVEMDGDIHT